jgi:hypothetical protein
MIEFSGQGADGVVISDVEVAFKHCFGSATENGSKLHINCGNPRDSSYHNRADVEVPIGATKSLPVTITNPSREPLRGVLKLETATWKVSPREVAISLAPGAKVTQNIQVSAPASGTIS